jgi:hypothetical protein
MRMMTMTGPGRTTACCREELASDKVAPAGVKCGTARESSYFTLVLTLEASHAADKNMKPHSLPGQAGVTRSLQKRKVVQLSMGAMLFRTILSNTDSSIPIHVSRCRVRVPPDYRNFGHRINLGCGWQAQPAVRARL